MAIEIERRFLVDLNTAGVKTLLDHWDQSKIEQGYLGSGTRVRTIIEHDVYDGDTTKTGKITVKIPAGHGTNKEFEYTIPYSDAAEILEHCEFKISKTRFYNDIEDDLVIELDVFDGELYGLAIAEIELMSIDQKFSIPSWFGLEVTGIPAYSNYALASSRHKQEFVAMSYDAVAFHSC